MKKNVSFIDEFAVSEVVGAMILVLIAVVAFAAIYLYVFPLPLPAPEPTVKLKGYVTDDGTAVLEHMGGESLSAYRIVVRQIDGTLINTTTYQNKNDPWEIGKCNYPPTNMPLLTENDKVNIDVYEIYDDGSEHQVFTGILMGKRKVVEPSIPSMLMLISSLRTDSIDEDLICYNYTINSSIDASTYVYNWSVNGNPITNLLMPFDTNSSIFAKDYSGNGHNGTVIGPVWINGGRVGGAYQFDGVNDYISLPYCFRSSFIDDITVEAWVKTASPSGVISSYNRNKYWELGVANGKIQWSTAAADGTKDTTSSSTVNDGNWHHVATTYDSSAGESAIYIDGRQNIKKSEHTLGELLGIGNTPQGWIGTGPEASRTTVFSTSFETQGEKNNWKPDNETWGGGGTLQWQTVFYDTFEGWWGSWGHWNDGGDNCNLYSGPYAHQGSYAVCLRHKSEPPDHVYPSSSTYSNRIYAVTAGYTQMSIDFWWKAIDMENGKDFWIRYYDGTNFHTLKTLVIGPGQYANNEFYHTVCYLNSTQYTFTNQMRFVIQCDASDDSDNIYLDQIYVNATTGPRVDYNFDLFDSTKLNPKTPNYSIGGTGDFDPEYAYFNRTGIDISGYKNVNLSVWYSYRSTTSTDKLGLYYKDGSSWITIFEITNPQIGYGNQSAWTHAQVQIPDHVDNLVLQFRWITSATYKYVAIDDLEITGVPLGGEHNFSGLIDEFHIYNRALSAEQIYQNYLYTKDGHSDKSVIVSGETYLGDIWKCVVTPNDGIQDDISKESNIVQIVTYPGGD